MGVSRYRAPGGESRPLRACAREPGRGCARWAGRLGALPFV